MSAGQNGLGDMELSSYLVGLVSISLNSCLEVTDSSLFTLVRKCPSLSEIIMKKIGHKRVENYDYLMDIGVYPRLKSLSLPFNQWLDDEKITIFVSAFPNLHLLDLKYCTNVSQLGVVQVLKRCPKISHLNLTACHLSSSKEELFEAYERCLNINNLNLPLSNLSSRVSLLEMNFEVPKLKMLNLSFSEIDDEALYSISKSCCGLLQLFLNDCSECTEKGVTHVIENCTQLREINLKNCRDVRNMAPSMLFSSPSLRKVTTAPCIFFTKRESILFLQRGCVVVDI
ncbi:uncharacterized protein LOC131613042 [Vicia villosa]|uniref:uncharacterized protein LOC131613042 n=1 Tax=Vicia villosa TaxID=3911 RepID=UPI00273CAD3C|nr:uncharacterized protein LOC131613042 [Vicia villosa]